MGENWQPIDTAPKDGSLVELWLVPDDEKMVIATPRTGAELENVVFGRYPKAKVSWWLQAQQNGYEALGSTADYCGWVSIAPSKYHPTHWRPIPQGPAA